MPLLLILTSLTSKHIKRHTRPYGCTFPNCYKRFGSRNDWKRHENSQHFLQEMWRCGLKTVNGPTCRKLIYHEETFINHLQRRHGLDVKSPKIQSHTKTMHLGREGHHHFWCGFCNKLIAQEDGKQQDSIQPSAWVMRFNHIGNHFDKSNDNIDDWVCIEHNKKKGLITKEDRKKAKTRLRNGKADDDSDLGDDGIPSSLVSGHSAPVSHAPVGHGPDMPAAVSMYTSNKRKLEDADIDADGVSD